MSRALPLVALAVLLTALGGVQSDLRAQERRTGAEVWGHVFLAGDTVSLPGVSVEPVDQSVSTMTTRTGFYRLAALSPGRHVLRVRRVGYQSVTLAVELEENGTLQRDIRLERLPTTLTEVRIGGRTRNVPPRFEDVYRRMTTANGTFFTREDIERLNPPDIQSLLMQVPTTRVNARGIYFARCNEGFALALSPQAGKVQIWIDGLRMTGRVGKSVDTNEVRDVLRLVNPTQIQAIEVYSGVSRIPGQFLEDACAVIAIWTRAY